MTKAFPDETQMPLSEDGTERIRGGSIGLNRILSRFVERAKHDRTPEFTVALLSASALFRNAVSTKWDKTPTLHDYEACVKHDIQLFLEYYDTYLSHANGVRLDQRRCTVVVYFPDYSHLPSDLVRPVTGKKQERQAQYQQFLSRFGGQVEYAKAGEHVECYFIPARKAKYPHHDLGMFLRGHLGMNTSAYRPADTIALLTNETLDYHLADRFRNVKVLKSFTGELVDSSTFKTRLDPEGRIPFNSVTHRVFGDDSLIMPMAQRNLRKLLLDYAVKERWLLRSASDIATKIVAHSDITMQQLRKYDFS